jgi:hypothetical protein
MVRAEECLRRASDSGTVAVTAVLLRMLAADNFEMETKVLGYLFVRERSACPRMAYALFDRDGKLNHSLPFMICWRRQSEGGLPCAPPQSNGLT